MLHGAGWGEKCLFVFFCVRFFPVVVCVHLYRMRSQAGGASSPPSSPPFVEAAAEERRCASTATAGVISRPRQSCLCLYEMGGKQRGVEMSIPFFLDIRENAFTALCTFCRLIAH